MTRGCPKKHHLSYGRKILCLPKHSSQFLSCPVSITDSTNGYGPLGGVQLLYGTYNEVFLGQSSACKKGNLSRFGPPARMDHTMLSSVNGSITDC